MISINRDRERQLWKYWTNRKNNDTWFSCSSHEITSHDDVIKWKLFPRYWPFVRGIHRSPVGMESIGDRWFPSKRPVTWNFDVFFDLRLNKRLRKQCKRWWFGTSSPSLWRHCNGMKRTECTIYASASDQHWTYRTILNEREAIFFQHNKGNQFLLLWSRTGVGLLKLRSLFSLWRKKIILPKYQLYHLHHINSLRQSNIYASVNLPSLVQIMACRLVGAKSLPEPMLEYCWLNPWAISVQC